MKRVVPIASVICLGVILLLCLPRRVNLRWPPVIDWFDRSLTRGLEEEKSYTRHAMLRYRTDPTYFRGNRSILKTWSNADFAANAIVSNDHESEWVRTSDQLTYVQPQYQLDAAGQPFCVLKRDADIILISEWNPDKCEPKLLSNVDYSKLSNGDLVWGITDNERTVFRYFFLRRTNLPPPEE